MIRGIHAMLYTGSSPEVRAFLRDVVGLPFIDAGDGWLIFDVPTGEIGCHPLMADDPVTGEEGRPRHEISLMTDDIHGTVATLREKGASFRGEVENRGWGEAVELILPDATTMTLYQPLYR